MTLQAFFDEYKQGTIENPMGDNRVWNWEALFYITPLQGKAHIQDLRSLKPKSGAGSKAMSWLVGLADKHGVTLTLFASPTPRAKTNISLPKLKKFYGNFGFKAKRGDDLMERLPVSISASIKDTRAQQHLNKRVPSGVRSFGAQTIREWVEELRSRSAVLKPDSKGTTYAWVGGEGWPLGKLELDYFNSLPAVKVGGNDVYVLKSTDEVYVDDDGAELPLYWSEYEGLVAPEDATTFRMGEWKNPAKKGFVWVKKGSIAASLSAVADAAAEVIQKTKVAKKVKAAVEEAAFYVALSAMTEAQAKQVLGFPASATPSPVDVKRAWQKAAMKYHPDRGGDPAMMVEVNVAKDILDGTRKPDKTYGPTTAPKQPPPPGPSSYKPPPPPPPKAEKVSKTAQAAAQEAGVLNSPWLGFFKQKSVGYSGDESSNWTYYFVAVAPDKDPTKVTLGVFIHYERDNGINGGASDVWEVKTVRVNKNEAAITKGVKMAYEAVAKNFGTSPPRAQTSRFHVTANLPESLPELLQKDKIIGTTVSMAELLQALGLSASEKVKKAAPKKSVVEILFRRQPPAEDGTSIRLLGLRLNGADPFWFTQEETVKFKLAQGLKLVFGEYLYDDNSKVLSRIAKRSMVASWLLKHTSMPDEYTGALQAIVDAAATA